MIKVALTGACGRMGKQISALVIEDKELTLVAPLEYKNHPDIGKPYSQIIGKPIDPTITLQAELKEKPDILIDFSTPDATSYWVDVCKEHKIAMVIGTTGLISSQLDKIKSASEIIPILYAPNMSVGMNLLFKLAGEIAKVLGDDYDIEIVEHHHRFKKDAPSGSALKLLDSILDTLGRVREEVAVFGRYGKDAQRKLGEIGIHAIRMGDVVGYHEVNYSTLGETITISHRASTRETFARGAIRAAKWIINQKPNLYSMQDLLFGE